MIETTLINRATIAKYKQISDSVYDDKLNQIIIECQITDLMPLLGERLLIDILKDPTQYTELLEGGFYTVDGVEYHNNGLEAVLVHYFYARYSMFGSVIDNPFGMTEKLNFNESKQIDLSTKKTLFNMNQQYAFNLWLSVKKYLIRKKTPLFNECNITQNKGNFKTYRVG
jgi:hypothetical protein